MKNHIINFITSIKNFIKNKRSSRLVHNKLKMIYLYHNLVRTAPDLKIQPSADAYSLKSADLVFISLYNHKCYSIRLSTSFGINRVTVYVSSVNVTRSGIVLDYTDTNYVLTVIKNLMYRVDRINFREERNLTWKTSTKNG